MIIIGMNRKLFPNPMSDVPYDVVTPASIGTLTDVTFAPFMNTPMQLRKRQTLSSQALISTEDLIKMCPLDNVLGKDVAAGCVAGIYNKFCSNPSDASLLAQCHDAYNRAFGASFFKPLGDVCPAWRKGPLSRSCVTAIKNFSYRYLVGNDLVTAFTLKSWSKTFLDNPNSHHAKLHLLALGKQRVPDALSPASLYVQP
jgi:hypothetical protein